MNEEKEVRAEIQRLKETLIGNLLEDMDTQQAIYDLKLLLNPEIAKRPELDDDECLSCGA
tara:strand:+ start:369 stop:548 length:180 start_codon:yes stop_codon:yes gene_type:complete